MKLKSLGVDNYRTLEEVKLEFPGYYTALCGRNDSGKSNVVRAIRALLSAPDDRYWFSPYRPDIVVKNDYTKWKAADTKTHKIEIRCVLVVDQVRDAGLYEFLIEFLKISERPACLELELHVAHGTEEPKKYVKVKVQGQEAEGINADQVLGKIRSSRAVVFHNSTESDDRLGPPSPLSDYAVDYASEFEKLKKSVTLSMNKIARKQQRELADLLGRLQEKYKVGLSLPPFEFRYLPYNVTLGDKKIDVDLDDWGSGTRNRTLILLALFRAKQTGLLTPTASKVTPIIVVEEPESFLHPSAQAEFGRILQQMPDEFGVQVITTTHSPYMLSVKSPKSNILLEREFESHQPRSTIVIETGEGQWMEPFGLALGVQNSEFEPWREALFANSECALLVEGEIDREYLELLRQPIHEDNRLRFDGKITPYGGKDNLKNSALLRFVRERCKKMFVTYDLDANDELQRVLEKLGLVCGRDFAPVGVDAPGKRNIEGLLPDEILNSVNTRHPDLVSALRGTTEERRSAASRLKRLYLDEFKATASPEKGHYRNLYALAKRINGALVSNQGKVMSVAGRLAAKRVRRSRVT